MITSQEKYNKSEKGKATRKRYDSTRDSLTSRKQYLHSDKGKARLAAQRRARRAHHREIVDKIKLEAGCARCGYNEAACALDFDHLRDKKFNVASEVGYASDERLLAEIAKCQVLCANCHRIKSNEV